MDDVMILLHRFMIDIQGFNEKHFLVFEEHEQAQLLNIWNQIKNDNLPVNKFLGILSPHQKYKVVCLLTPTQYKPNVFSVLLINRYSKNVRF